MVKVEVKKKQFNAIIKEDETGGYFAHIPSLPGCNTQGETKEETFKNIKEAIELYLEVKYENIK